MNNRQRRKRHRHAVALPLLLVAIAVSSVQIRENSSQVTATLQRMFLSPGAEAHEEEGGFAISEGSGLFFGPGMLRVSAGEVQVLGFDGGIFLTLTDDELTGAAVSTPVLIKHGRMRAVIPEGMQWSGKRAEPLSSLDQGFSTWVADRKIRFQPEHFRKRQLEVALRTPVEKAALSEAAPGTAEQIELLRELSSDSDLWLLAAVNSETHTALWSLSSASSLTPEEIVAVIYAFPFADFGSTSLSDFAYARFAREIYETASHLDTPSVFVEDLASVFLPLVSNLEDLGFPRRKARLQDIVEDLLRSYEGSLSDRGLALLEDIAHMKNIPVEPLSEETPVVLPVNDTETAEPPSLPPEEVEARVSTLLTEAGALFTVKTGVANVAPNSARVSDVLFSGDPGDTWASFTMNVVTGIVSDIEVDGRSGFPFDPPFDVFVDWVKKSSPIP